MSKVVLFAASLLLVAGIATAGIINPCGSPVVYNGPVAYQGASSSTLPPYYFACPQGDTKSLKDSGFWFGVTVNDGSVPAQPIADIPGTDFWLIDCDPLKDMALCAGSASSGADSATNSLGQTTISNTTLRVGGCVDGLSVVVQGYVLGPAPAPCGPYCFIVKVRSCDMTNDLLINVADLGMFSTFYPPNVFNTCADFDGNLLVNIQDLARLAFHYGPPGHKCV